MNLRNFNVLQTSITDNKKATEYSLFAGVESFYVIERKRDDRRLKIPCQEFAYPQFISEQAILEELKERIEKFFEKSKEKVILLSYSAVEEKVIKQIIIDNKREFDL